MSALNSQFVKVLVVPPALKVMASVLQVFSKVTLSKVEAFTEETEAEELSMVEF